MGVVIILLSNREPLEAVENNHFDSETDLIDALRASGMTEKEEETLGYYKITDFMGLVNDQVLDDLRGTFFGYVNIK